ncbi:LacI family DNA-binding transcriptional regulator [Peterkaempfera bronchialis]|uniref:LacI family transcriptional regulator n=1 Tax=Peterkaempfera bronchialis TaxID=2126346 RepID=A0A345SSZ4_9ACTN|nr:LacI family DNA-binding transcriptional regulator [Peterkaempfera bronchialis]AXI76849.1 LacI family transcriptional regulator [Peterkaempfera bronchialis]
MRVTIADVARRAGVSKATVSRVLNGKADVDADTAQRIREVIAETGYVPSSRAVGLARGRTRTVGMLVPSLTWPWIGDVLQGVVDVLEADGYGVLLYTCTRGEESLRRFADQVSGSAFDGLLVIEPENTLDYIAELHRKGLPVVLIDDRGHHVEFPSVATTNRDGGASAARHLAALGRRRPAVVTGHLRFGCVRDRSVGFAEAAEAAGLHMDPQLVVEGDFTEESGRAAVHRLLAAGTSFDSVFAHNDLSAAGVLRALRETGRRVPEDVAVIGFDDIPLASHTEPGLTTVRQPMREMGEAAAGLLLSHLQGVPMSPTPFVLPTTLVVRGSAPMP